MAYITLTANQRWIKPIGSFEANEANGITSGEIANAQNRAKAITDSTIGWMYDISDWDTTTPAIVALANDFLASSFAMEMYLNRDTNVTVGEQYMPETLWARGREILEAIINGSMEVMDSDGNAVTRLRKAPRRTPYTLESAAHFFPDTNCDRSFRQFPRITAERTFKL